MKSLHKVSIFIIVFILFGLPAEGNAQVANLNCIQRLPKNLQNEKTLALDMKQKTVTTNGQDFYAIRISENWIHWEESYPIEIYAYTLSRFSGELTTHVVKPDGSKEYPRGFLGLPYKCEIQRTRRF